jgi:hypothetical protein
LEKSRTRVSRQLDQLAGIAVGKPTWTKPLARRTPETCWT